MELCDSDWVSAIQISWHCIVIARLSVYICKQQNLKLFDVQSWLAQHISYAESIKQYQTVIKISQFQYVRISRYELLNSRLQLFLALYFVFSPELCQKSSQNKYNIGNIKIISPACCIDIEHIYSAVPTIVRLDTT